MIKNEIHQEVDFKPNSILQNQLISWGLHTFIYYWKVSSLVDVGFQQNLFNKYINIKNTHLKEKIILINIELECDIKWK